MRKCEHPDDKIVEIECYGECPATQWCSFCGALRQFSHENIPWDWELPEISEQEQKS